MLQHAFMRFCYKSVSLVHLLPFLVHVPFASIVKTPLWLQKRASPRVQDPEASFFALPAFAEEQMDAATMALWPHCILNRAIKIALNEPPSLASQALKDATEEAFDIKRPNKIDLGHLDFRL